MVNEQIFQGNWTEIRGRVKEKWGSLTDDDLILAEGRMDRLIGIIERRTGESREKIEHELVQMTSDYGSQMDRIRQQASAAATSASGAAREYADHASELARQQYEQLQKQYGDMSADLQARYAEAEAAIRRKPIESIVVALGAGLVAGALAGLLLRPSRD